MKWKKVSEVIKKYLEENGIKQEFLVSKTRIASNTLSDILNGKRRLLADELVEIILALNVDANYLLNYDEIKKERDNNIDFGLLNQYKILFDKDDRLTKEQKKFFMDFLEERHKRIDEKEEKGS